MLQTLLLALACAPVQVEVLVFNIEYGGGLVDFARTVEVVERSAPDIVLVEEAWGQIPRLARLAGFPEHDVRHQVLSRRPLLDPLSADARFLYAELSPGCVVALANVHLPSDPDPPDVMADAAAVEAAMAVERRTRSRALEPTLAALRALLAAGVPVLLGGDFNAPSHLDDPHPWPVSRAIAEAGLRDVWREVYPDARTHPGFTWWAARPQVPGWNPAPTARQTRIDQLHAGGRVAVKRARLVGEAGRAGIDIGVAPWPSDHRAIVATLEITPGPVPALVTAWPTRVRRGEEIRVRARGFAPGSRVVVLAAGVAVRADGSGQRARLEDMSIATTQLAPGPHNVVLVDPAENLVSRASFWVAASEAKPAIAVERERVRPDQPIDVRWTEAPGYRWDWVGVYAAGTDPDSEGQPLLWRHTRATVAGIARLDSTAEGDGWPLRPGSYRTCLFEDDAYVPLACAPFTVEP